MTKKIDGSDIELVDIEAFGYKFKKLFPGNAEDLITLEKEGAIYVNHYDKQTKRFNYYRVKFLPKEIVDYVQAHIEQQKFFEGMKKFKDDFNKALSNVSNKKIAERVRNYESYIEKGGKRIKVDLRGNLASFLGKELEELVCFHTNPSRYELLPKINTKDKIAIILDIEVKFVRDKKRASLIPDEIKIDIESYHTHKHCETLAVLIYDPGKNIIDPKCIMQDLSGLRVINKKRFEVKTIVKN